MIILVFFKRNNNNPQITSSDNPYLDHIVTNLWRISRPGACAQVAAFPLEWLFPSFERKYYTYSGSLTQPPCSEIVTWIVKPEPLAISSTQVCMLNFFYYGYRRSEI